MGLVVLPLFQIPCFQEFSDEFQKWLGGDALLEFQMTTFPDLLRAMKEVGFIDITSRDRNEWYRDQSRREVQKMAGPDRQRFEAVLGKDETDKWIEATNLKAIAVEKGDLRPHHFRGRKPL